MENPEPVREHRVLEKLTGHYSGPERMHPSYFNEKQHGAHTVTDARVALDGFAVVQDYTQELDDGTRFAGHGVFRYDTPSDTYELHWFDSTGGPERIFRGGFADNMLVLTARVGDGWQRLTYDFNLEGGYRLKIETSEDGKDWKVAIEGDNFIAPSSATRAGKVARKTAMKTAKKGAKQAGTKAATGKAPARKSSARKTTVKKTSPQTTAKKKIASKAAAKRTVGKKTPGRKVSARKAAKKAAAKKTAGKTAAKKTAAKKVAKKATAKKTVAKKAVTRRKAAAKSTPRKKAATKKPVTSAAARKAAGKKTKKKVAKKAGAKVRVSALERDRHLGKASRKIGPKKKTPITKATRATVAQKQSKSAAQKGPRMEELKSTSTRIGWHRTAAKGKLES